MTSKRALRILFSSKLDKSKHNKKALQIVIVGMIELVWKYSAGICRVSIEEKVTLIYSSHVHLRLYKLLQSYWHYLQKFFTVSQLFSSC